MDHTTKLILTKILSDKSKNKLKHKEIQIKVINSCLDELLTNNKQSTS